ncbi:hypothetical protein ACLIYP_00475 [Streptomyces nanhaiensis]|uniref:hypothetical protein n=1 Tax=Streptomyces nanhaiensis TaxID=679319 RepID=UPI00399CD622
MRQGKPQARTLGAVLVAGALWAGGCATAQVPDGAAKAADAETSAGTAGRPLSVKQLKTLALREAEVPQAGPGGTPVQERKLRAGRPSFPPVSDPACQEVLEVSRGEGAFAAVEQVFNWKDSLWAGSSILASYKGTGAQEAFARLQAGVETCTSYSGTGYVGEFRARLAVESPPRTGDEAVSYRTVIPLEEHLLGVEETTGEDPLRQEQTVVVLVGTTIATFNMLDVDGSASFPPDLIDIQVDRLKRAQRR